MKNVWQTPKRFLKKSWIQISSRLRDFINLLDSIQPSVSLPAHRRSSFFVGAEGVCWRTKCFKGNKPRVIFQRAFYSNSKQTNMKNLKPWSQHKEALFGELNELWRCGSLAHPAGVLINHCQPERTNLCCCTRPRLMCTLGEALKDNKKRNLVLNLYPLLILVFWSLDWVGQMNHRSAFALVLTHESRICPQCLLQCYFIGADSGALPTSHTLIWTTQMEPTDSQH